MYCEFTTQMTTTAAFLISQSREPRQQTHLLTNGLCCCCCCCCCCFQGCIFVNNSDHTLSWTLDTKSSGRLLENGTFKFLHRTGSTFTPSSSGNKSAIPEITLESGETFQLGVLFTPRKSTKSNIPILVYRVLGGLTLKLELLRFTSSSEAYLKNIKE